LVEAYAALRVLVSPAFFAAWLRARFPRLAAALFACRDRALRLAAERGCFFNASSVARERVVEGFRLERDARVSCCAFLRVLADPLAGSFTPERRALDNPMAIACFVDAAPCFPSRM
jgi:hypothetical protein